MRAGIGPWGFSSLTFPYWLPRASGDRPTLIAPLKVDAAGLEQLGFMPSKTVKAAKHYQASSIPAMVQAMLTHLQGVLATA